jgi:hypothetical protein
MEGIFNTAGDKTSSSGIENPMVILHPCNDDFKLGYKRFF